MKRVTTCTLAVFALLAIPCLPASADIYQYTDENGVIHFSNVSVGKSKKFKTVKAEPRKKEEPAESAPKIPGPLKASSSASVPQSYIEIINSACYYHGVDPSLVHAVIKVESDFNPYAMSKKGAMGLMQLMPETARQYAVSNPYDPTANIEAGVKHLKSLLDRLPLSLALAAYNAGEATVQRFRGIPPYPETRNYVDAVLRLASR
jgi:soluble lytic murein transglycosylase-like protein